MGDEEQATHLQLRKEARAVGLQTLHTNDNGNRVSKRAVQRKGGAGMTGKEAQERLEKTQVL